MKKRHLFALALVPCLLSSCGMSASRVLSLQQQASRGGEPAVEAQTELAVYLEAPVDDLAVHALAADAGARLMIGGPPGPAADRLETGLWSSLSGSGPVVDEDLTVPATLADPRRGSAAARAQVLQALALGADTHRDARLIRLAQGLPYLLAQPGNEPEAVAVVLSRLAEVDDASSALVAALVPSLASVLTSPESDGSDGPQTAKCRTAAHGLARHLLVRYGTLPNLVTALDHHRLDEGGVAVFLIERVAASTWIAAGEGRAADVARGLQALGDRAARPAIWAGSAQDVAAVHLQSLCPSLLVGVALAGYRPWLLQESLACLPVAEGLESTAVAGPLVVIAGKPVIDHRWAGLPTSVPGFRERLPMVVRSLLLSLPEAKALLLAAQVGHVAPAELVTALTPLLADPSLSPDMRLRLARTLPLLTGGPAAQAAADLALTACPHLLSGPHGAVQGAIMASVLLPGRAADVRMALGKLTVTSAIDGATTARLLVATGLGGDPTLLTHVMRLPKAWPLLVDQSVFLVEDRLVALTTAFPAEVNNDPAIVQAAVGLTRALRGQLSPSVQAAMTGWISSDNDEVSLCAATACVEALGNDPAALASVSSVIQQRWPTLLGGE